jgi:hypothetical protein
MLQATLNATDEMEGKLLVFPAAIYHKEGTFSPTTLQTEQAALTDTQEIASSPEVNRSIAPFPDSKIEIAVALQPNTEGLCFKKGEKILIDRTAPTEPGYVFGRIGTREGAVPMDTSLIQI